MLELRNIHKSFGDVRVLDGVDICLEERKFTYSSKEQRWHMDEILKMISMLEKRNELAGEIFYGQQNLLITGCCITNNAEVLLYTNNLVKRISR